MMTSSNNYPYNNSSSHFTNVQAPSVIVIMNAAKIIFHTLFAVARWLLCLSSDYKSATCSEM